MKLYLQETHSYPSSDLLLLHHQPAGVSESRARLVQLHLEPGDPGAELLAVLPLHVPHPVHGHPPLLHCADAGLLHLPPHGQVSILNTGLLFVETVL